MIFFSLRSSLLRNLQTQYGHRVEVGSQDRRKIFLHVLKMIWSCNHLFAMDKVDKVIRGVKGSLSHVLHLALSCREI